MTELDSKIYRLFHITGTSGPQEFSPISKLDWAYAFQRRIFWGEGCFTSMLVKNGVICFKDHHLKRLIKSALFLWPNLYSSSDETVLHEKLQQLILLLENEMPQGEEELWALRLFLGPSWTSEDKFAVSKSDGPLIAYTDMRRIPSDSGIIDAIVQARYPKHSVLPSFLKLGHYTETQLELQHAKREHQAQDIFWCDQQEHVLEASTSNLFCVIKGEMLTPTLRPGVLQGVARELLLQTVTAIKQKDLTLKTLEQAEEIWLSNALRGIVPVRKLRFQQGEIKLNLDIGLSLKKRWNEIIDLEKKGLYTQNA